MEAHENCQSVDLLYDEPAQAPKRLYIVVTHLCSVRKKLISFILETLAVKCQLVHSCFALKPDHVICMMLEGLHTRLIYNRMCFNRNNKCV